MKKIVLLATAALVAMLILVPIAMAQDADVEVTRIEEETVIGDLPTSGGMVAPSVLLPAAALLLGSGVVAYALVRRR